MRKTFVALLGLFLIGHSAYSQPGPPSPGGRGVAQFSFHDANGFTGTVTNPTGPNAMLTIQDTRSLQPLNSNLTTISGMTLASYGLGFLTQPNSSSAVAYIGAAYDANVVHNAGNETIAGVKTFSSLPIISSATASSIAFVNSTKGITSISTTANRGKAKELWIADRVVGDGGDGLTGSGTEEDPLNSTNDLASIWPGVLTAAPSVIHFINPGGGHIFFTSNFLEALDGQTWQGEGTGPTIQATSAYWGQNAGVLSGEQGIIGETNLLGPPHDVHNNVTIKNLTIDCNNHAQIAANPRVCAIWLRGNNNSVIKVHFINWGNEDAGGAEQFPLRIGTDGYVGDCTFDTQAMTTHGTISVVSGSAGHDLTSVAPVYRIQFYHNTFTNTYSQQGGFIAGINLQNCNFCDVTYNTFNTLNRGSAVYQDTGIGYQNSITHNRFLDMRRNDGSSGNGSAVVLSQIGGTNTQCDISYNIITLGPNSIGIQLSYTGTSPNGEMDMTVSHNIITQDPSESIAFLAFSLQNLVGGVVDHNYVGTGFDTQPFRMYYCDNVRVEFNTTPAVNHMSAVTNPHEKYNYNLSYALLSSDNEDPRVTITDIATVDVNGNDSTGAVGDGFKPFATIGAANTVATFLSGLGHTVEIQVGVGTWTETPIQLADNVSLIGKGRRVTFITGVAGLTNPLIQPGANSMISGLTATSTGSNSSPIGAGSASNAFSSVIIENCKFTGTSDCVYLNRASLGSLKAFDSVFTSTFDTLFSNASSGGPFEFTGCEFNTNGSTGLTARDLVSSAGTIIMYGGKLVATKTGTNISALAQGGAISLYGTRLTRNSGGSSFDLQQTSGTLSAQGVVRDDGAPLSNSGAITMKSQTVITTFAGLNGSPTEGDEGNINDGKAANCGDSSCTTFGTTVTAGGGALHLKVRWNGTAWTLEGL